MRRGKERVRRGGRRGEEGGKKGEERGGREGKRGGRMGLSPTLNALNLTGRTVAQWVKGWGSPPPNMY